jgi:hypothetical protein
MYGVSCRCNGRFDLGQWVRFAQKTYKSPTQTAREGPASALTATQARVLVRHNHGGSPRTGRMLRMMLPSSTRTILVGTPS